MQHVDHRIVQLLENISGFVFLLILLMSTELLSFGKSEQRKGRLELPVFKLDRRSALFNQREDDLPNFIWA